MQENLTLLTRYCDYQRH